MGLLRWAKSLASGVGLASPQPVSRAADQGIRVDVRAVVAALSLVKNTEGQSIFFKKHRLSLRVLPMAARVTTTHSTPPASPKSPGAALPLPKRK